MSNYKPCLITTLLNELHQIDYTKYNLDKTARLEKLEEIYHKIKQIDNSIRKMSNKDLENVDINYLNVLLPLFNLAYYGENVRHIIELIVGIYRFVFKSHIQKVNDYYDNTNRYNKSYKKIGVLTERFNRFSSVLRDRLGILMELAKEPNIQLDLITTLPLDKAVEQNISCFKNIYQFKDTITKNVEFVGNQRYDIIIYPDLHMDCKTSGLSLFKLAPIQLTTFGHSETSGTCDYFINSVYFEGVNPQENYTEKLILIPSLNMRYSNVIEQNIKQNYKPLSHFLLPNDKRLYLFSASFFKCGKEMFDIFNGILEKDENGLLLFTRLGEKYDTDFYKAIENYIKPELLRRIVFLPRLSCFELMNLNSLVNVSLDAYPFGSLNTSLECFEEGLPVICWPTNKTNGRFTKGFYDKMGIGDRFVVNSIEEYIEKAIKTAQISGEERQVLKVELQMRSRVLFNDMSAVADWKRLIFSL